MKYGESKSLNDYDQEPSFWNGISLNKVEFWAYQYDFSFQFWGPGNNNVFINRDDVEVHSSWGFDTVIEMFDYVIKWCEKANPSVMYPISIAGKEIDLPD